MQNRNRQSPEVTDALAEVAFAARSEKIQADEAKKGTSKKKLAALSLILELFHARSMRAEEETRVIDAANILASISRPAVREDGAGILETAEVTADDCDFDEDIASMDCTLDGVWEGLDLTVAEAIDEKAAAL